MTRHTPFTRVGTITAIGEQPIKGVINPKAMIGMAIGEMLLNMVWGVIPSLRHVKCSGNWMWPNSDEYEQYLLYDCVKEVNRIMTRLGIAIDGGKDSMSMHSEINGNIMSSVSITFIPIFNHHFYHL